MVLTPIQQNIVHNDVSSSKRCRIDDGGEGSTKTPKNTASSHWKRLYSTLQNERITQAEENLTLFCQESERREHALKAYIGHLENELRKAKKTIQLCENQAADIVQLQQRNKELEMFNTKQHETILKQVTRLEEKEQTIEQNCQTIQNLDRECKVIKDVMVAQNATLKQQENELHFYKRLTAITVIFSNKTMECTVTNEDKDTFLKFYLTELDNNTDMKYVPIANVTVLPKFLHQAVEFPKADAPSFLQLVLKGMFPE